MQSKIGLNLKNKINHTKKLNRNFVSVYFTELIRLCRVHATLPHLNNVVARSISNEIANVIEHQINEQLIFLCNTFSYRCVHGILDVFRHSMYFKHCVALDFCVRTSARIR